MKNSKFIHSFLLIFILSFSVSFWSATSQAEEVRTITIHSEGSAGKSASQVKIPVAVITYGDSFMEAVEENNEKMDSIITAAKEMDIALNDIKTSMVDFSPQYIYNNSTGQQERNGYKASNQVTITVRDIDRVGEVLTGLGNAGADQISGLNFTVDNPSELLETARKDAMTNAIKEAKQYAEAGGFKIATVPLKVDESGGYAMPPSYAGGSLESADGGGDVPVSPGEVTYSASITVIFAIIE